MEGNLNKKTTVAMKWSAITEILAKLITPLINMILARILAPEAFGVLATVTMVISFAEVFVESGFQKFLIQHNFGSEEESQRFFSVAFWANIAFSSVIWVLLIVFANPIAALAGNGGLGHLIAISGIAVPLYGIIGIQNSLLKKKLEFKGLFYVRVFSALVPLFVTLPLALLGFDYWSLIIGNIAGVVVQSVLLIFVGKFKPKKYFNFKELRYMLKFGIWTFLDGIATWLTVWVDSLLIAHYMTDYYLGLYKNSISTINTVFTLITAALTPVLFSSLSKLQDDQEKFNALFSAVYKKLCLFLFPICVGLFAYKELATYVMFGESWMEAASIIGIMSLTTGIRTIFVSLYSDVFRAKGKFHIPLIMQIVDLVVIVAVCSFAVQDGFWTLVYARAFVKLDLVIPSIILVRVVCKIPILKMLKDILPVIVSTASMIILIVILQSFGASYLWAFGSIFLCAIVYFGVLFLFKKEREELLIPVLKKLKIKR